MRSSLLFGLLGLAVLGGCKSKYLNFRSGGDSKKSANPSAEISSADVATENSTLPRPTVSEETFKIPDPPASTMPEGSSPRRADGSIEVSGAVSGVWDSSLAKVYVVGDLTLGAGKTLVVKSGVNVVFRGKYRLSIEGGSLKVEGSPSQRVLFTAENTETGWAGIRMCPDPNCQSEENVGRLEVRFADFEWARKDNMDVNDNTWRRGGVLYVRSTVTAIIEDSRFRNNYAQERGGALEIIANNPNVIFRRNLLQDNSNDGGGSGGGGALHITHGRNLTIEGNQFVGNSSKVDGGAVFLLDSASIALRNNRFQGNSAVTSGGAIRCDGHAGSISIDASNTMSSNSPNDTTCDP